MRVSCRRVLGTLLFGALAGPGATAAIAQTPDSTVSRRFRFAELFVGADMVGLGGADGGLPLASRAVPRAVIGGLHFWGRADFAVLFPLSSGKQDVDGRRSTLNPGIETRGRWLLRPLDRANWSPYVGAALGAVQLQVGEGPRVLQVRPVAQAGVSVRAGRTLLEAGWSYRPGSTLRYPEARDRLATIDPRPHAWTIGVHRLFETTAALGPQVASGATAARESRWRADGRLSGPSLAVGPTSLILTGAMHWNGTERSFLAQRPRSRPALDVGLGWYDDRRDWHANVAWRRGRFRSAAFDFTQENTRESLAIEAFAFMGDYHGFVPFAGPVLSLERLRVRETDGNARVTDAQRTALAPGVVFGWDIRPTRAESWLLRTNLRWFPRLRVPVAGGEQTLDQLEFNFIQLVWYPRRRD